MSFQITNDTLSVNESPLSLSGTRIKIGTSAGEIGQGANTVAIGNLAGAYNQTITSGNGVAIGVNAGQTNQGQHGIAIGAGAGSIYQSIRTVAIGRDCGKFTQGASGIAIGFETARTTQKENGIAFGRNAGDNNQGGIAIGSFAGRYTQGLNAIAIGISSGSNSQGTNSIAIGNLAGVGTTNSYQISNSIILNASSSAISNYTYTTQSGFYVEPIRGTGASGGVSYDSSTKELTYSSTKTFIIDHPIDSSRYLVHACLEGPEAGVYYRGKSEITNDESVEILLPEYTKAFSEFTVHITPIYNNNDTVNTYHSTDVIDGKFTVHGNNGKFFWIVYALRDSIDTEPLKAETKVNGDGPYRYVTI